MSLEGIILYCDYVVRVIVPSLANDKSPESISWKIDIDWELQWIVLCKTDTELILTDEPWDLDWVVSCKTDTWEYRLNHIGIDIDYGIAEEPWVLD